MECEKGESLWPQNYGGHLLKEPAFIAPVYASVVDGQGRLSYLDTAATVRLLPKDDDYPMEQQELGVWDEQHGKQKDL